MAYTVSVLDARSTGSRVTKVQAIYERMREQWAVPRSQSLKSFEYVIGNQIDDDVREKLRQENRPAMVFNLMQPKIVTIAGLLESNKMFMRAVPIGEGDEQTADMRTRLVSDWAMRNCNGVQEITKAALDAAIGKIGWTNNYWSTKDSIEGKWYTESYDPFMILFDADARKKDQTDWRYMCVTGFYTADEIVSIYADKIDEETIQEIFDADARISGLQKADGSTIPASWVERVWSGVQDFFTRATLTKKTVNYEGGVINDFVDSRMGRYRVIEFHDRRTKIRTVFYNTQTREMKDMEGSPATPVEDAQMADSQLQALNLASGGGWVKKTYVQQELWVTACAPWLLPNKMLYEQPYPVQGKGYQYKPVFCYNFHPDITKTQSLIDILADPQDSYNQRRMTFLEWLMDAVNPDIWAPQGSIEALDIPTWQSKIRGKLKWFKSVGNQKPERQHPLAEASSLKVFADEDRDLAETLTNVTPNTQGQSENTSESGVLFAQKVQRAMTALSYFFGNVTFAMEEIFKYCDGNLQVFMTAPRKVRLLSSTNETEWVALNWPTLNGVLNDMTQGEYDFKADTVQLGETAKQVKFAEALSFIRTIPPQLVKWDEIFKLWDSPVAETMGAFAAQVMGVALQAQQAQAIQQQQQSQLQNLQGAAGAAQALEGVNSAANPAEIPDEGAGRKMISRGVA
jgi:hypothetical protein